MMPRTTTGPTTALVLSGGGARAAYQAGYLKGLAEILDKMGVGHPFSIFSGTSAGAINSTHLAAHLDQGFLHATEELWNLWANLSPDRIFQTGPFSLTRIGMAWAVKLLLGGSFGTQKMNALLDTSPLQELLSQTIDFEKIQQLMDSGLITGMSLTATNYQTGTAVCFFQSHQNRTAPWYRSDRIGVSSTLSLQHVMASSSIPIFFPPIAMDGFYYGDGCVRQTTPLSPPIHLGAERVFSIGIRAMRSALRTRAMNRPREDHDLQFAQIGGTLLNAVFLDSIERDAERLERINRTVSRIPPEQRGHGPEELKVIPFYLARPSRDLGKLARGIQVAFPPTLRHMIKGLGAQGRTGGDLMSYLAFDSQYTQKLLHLGHQDAHRNQESLIQFFKSEH